VSSGPGVAPQVATGQMQDTNNIEPKLEAPVKEPAAIEKTHPAVEKPMKVVTVECKTCPDANRDPNAPEPNINEDWYVRMDGKLGPRYDSIGMMAFSPDGNHIAYSAKVGLKFHLIVDGNAASPEFGSR
ncbi:MAG: hypothetical protein ABSG99_09710, partial [Sedimentisphaerales bacterium]